MSENCVRGRSPERTIADSRRTIKRQRDELASRRAAAATMTDPIARRMEELSCDQADDALASSAHVLNCSAARREAYESR